MKDYRNDFLKNLQTKITDFQNSDAIIAIVSNLLDNYELTERSTEITTIDTENQQLLKVYYSNLLLDGKSKGTIYQYSRKLMRFCDYIGNKSLKEITTFDIRRYLANEKERGLSNVSIDNIRAVLTAFYVWLTAEEYIVRNPCLAVHPIKCAKEKKIKFSSLDIDALRNSCKSLKERALIEFLLSSGVRVSELVALRVDDINFASRSVHIFNGKGGKERYTYIDQLAKNYLVKYLTESEITCGALFQNQHGKHCTTSGIRYILNTIANRSGIENVHPHRFRRTFASNMNARGMDITDIKELLGHESIETTMIYLDIDSTTAKHSYEKCVA